MIDLGESIGLLFPIDESGYLVALRCFVDAGENEDRVYSVACVAFGYGRAKKAEKEWQSLMGGRVFHMTDLHAREGAFKGIGEDERTEIIIGVSRIVREYASFATCISFDTGGVLSSLPQESSGDRASRSLLKGLKKKYGQSLNVAMHAIGGMVRRGGRAGPQLSYLLETGDDGQGDYLGYLDFFMSREYGRDILDNYSFRQYSKVPKGCGPGILGAPDFLAWEWSRHVTNSTKGIPLRKSLRAAMPDDVEECSSRYGAGLSNRKSWHLFHLSGDDFTQALSFQSDLLKEEEDATEIVDRFFQWRDQT